MSKRIFFDASEKNKNKDCVSYSFEVFFLFVVNVENRFF